MRDTNCWRNPARSPHISITTEDFAMVRGIVSPCRRLQLKMFKVNVVCREIYFGFQEV